MAKRYKRFKWAQYILFGLSLVSCLAPPVISAIRLMPSIKTTESKFALGGVAVFFAAMIILIVCRNLVRKFIHKLPYALTVMISIGIMLLLMLWIKRIIDDAIAILVVGLIGAAVSFVLELASMYCKSAADEAKEMYYRGIDQDV